MNEDGYAGKITFFMGMVLLSGLMVVVLCGAALAVNFTLGVILR